MLSFANPILLLGLLSLIIPILIHLFNKSRGKLVPIGNIELIRQAKKVSVTQIKITHWLLLILRCLIFLLATLLIAQLFYQGNLVSKNKTEILVTSDWLKLANKSEIDNLLTQENAEHILLLSQQFESLTREKINLIINDNTPTTVENVWSLVAERADQLHINNIKDIEVYLSDYWPDYRSQKPTWSSQLTERVSWHFKKQPQTEAVDDSNNTSFNVVILADENRNLHDLQRALTLIKQHQLSGLNIQRVANSNSVPTDTHFLFYLSNTALPMPLLQQVEKGLVVLQDANTEQITKGQWQIDSSQSLVEKLLIYRYQDQPFKQNKQASFQAIWQLSNRQPLLTKQWLAHGQIIHFQSRFEPTWSNIVNTPQFPALLINLLSSHHQLQQFQHVVIAPEQIELNIAESDSGTNTTIIDQNTPEEIQAKQSLYSLLSILLFLCWIAERLLSEKVVNEKRRTENTLSKRKDSVRQQ